MPDPIDILIQIQATGNQIANQTRVNVNELRTAVQKLIALNAGQLRANAQQVGSLQQLVAAQRQTIQSINQLSQAQRAHQQVTARTTSGLRDLVTTLGIAAAAFKAFQGFTAFTEAGLEFNSTIENANLGIATLITAEAKLHDENGNLLTGTKALGAAQDLAAEQVTKLRIAGLQTVATTQELIKAFQQAVGIGLRWGFTLDQAREFTVRMSQAAAALQLPMDQLNEEIRSLLQGTINPRNTRIATALHITNEQIRQAKDAGQLFDFISKRLEAFGVAGEATARTFSGVMSNIKEAMQQLTGEATQPLFDKLKETGQKTLEEVFDMKNARISENFSGIIDVAKHVFGGLGDVLSDAINAAVKGAEEFSKWLTKNKFLVTDMYEGFKIVAGQIGGLIKDIASVVTGLLKMDAEMGIFNVGVRIVALTVALIRDGLKAIVGILGFIGGLVLELLLDPLRLVLKAIAAVVQFTNKDMADSLRENAEKINGFLTDVSHGVKDIWKDFASGNTAYQQVLDQFDQMGKAADKTTAKVKETSKALLTVNPPGDTGKRDPAKLAAAITAAAKAELSRQKRDLQIALDQNLISYREYYDSLTKAQQHAIDEQIRAQKILLNAAKTDDAREKVRSDIKQLGEERKQVAEDNAEDLRKALEKLDEQIRTAQIQLLKDQGRYAEARALEVEAEFKKSQARLVKNAKTSGAEIVANLFNIDNAKARVQEFEKSVQTIQAELQSRLDEINVQNEAHAIKEADARHQIADAYDRARVKLQAILPLMKEAAEVTQDPATLQAVEDLRIKMEHWGVAVLQARDDLLQFKEGAKDAFQTGIANFIDETTQGFQNWGERVKDVGRQIVAALRQVAAQMLATLIIQNSLKMFGFASGGLAAVGGGTAGAAMSGDVGPSGVAVAAGGGYITGPGTSTSDSIPARLSHGEYVIKAASVKALGVDLLDEINDYGSNSPRVRRRARGYADGGLVTSSSTTSGAFSATLGLEEGLVVRHMSSRAGQDSVVSAVARNRKSILAILSGR